MNPFKQSPVPIDNIDKLVGRTDVFEKLKIAVETGQNTVVLGVEGVGKTSIINTFFSDEYKEIMLKEKNRLIYITTLSGVDSCDDLCRYLFEELWSEVRFAELDSNISTKVEHEFERLSETAKSGKALYDGAIHALKRIAKLKVILVMDAFERFTTSEKITKEHHDILRALIELNLLQCIVITNYDLEQDSLPKDVSDSLYLQKFANKIRVGAFSFDEAKRFVDLNMDGKNLKFQDDFLTMVYEYSGGIPHLFERMLHQAYDAVKCDKANIMSKDFADDLYDSVKPIFKSWCKIITKNQEDAIELLKKEQDEPCYISEEFDYSDETEAILKAAKILEKRGFFKCSEDDNCFLFNSVVLQRFIYEDKDYKEVLLNNPLTIYAIERAREEEDEQRRRSLEIIALEKGNAPQIVQNFIFGDGTIKNFGELFRKMLVNSEISQSGTPLLESINKNISDKCKEIIANADEIVEAEFYTNSEAQIDKAFSEIGDECYPIEEFLEDADTDSTFNEIIKKKGIEENFTSDRMNMLSDTCRSYLKAAIIFEEKFSPLAKYCGNDYSVCLVMYGKCLEQCLRDSFFTLFKECEPFRRYDTYKGINSPSGNGSFAVMESEIKALLGNFYHIINPLKEKLAEQCHKMRVDLNSLNVSTMGLREWNKWWESFSDTLDKAKNIRNNIHAGAEITSLEKIAELQEYLFGADGLLWKAGVGNRLYQRMSGKGGPKITDLNINAYKGKTFTMIQCKLENKKIDGILVIDGKKYDGRVTKQELKSSEAYENYKYKKEDFEMVVEIIGLSEQKDRITVKVSRINI